MAAAVRCVSLPVQVSGKLIDKERTLEEEIQLRERIQLQCKQAERSVEDLHMELQATQQARDDLAIQLKQAQVQSGSFSTWGQTSNTQAQMFIMSLL